MGTKPSNPVDTFGYHVGQLLLAVREQAGLPQVDVSAAVGVSQSQLSKMERGKRAITIDELDRWCAKLAIDLCRLLDEAHSMTQLSGDGNDSPGRPSG